MGSPQLLSPVLTQGAQSPGMGGLDWLSPLHQAQHATCEPGDPAGGPLDFSIGCSFSLECLSLPSLPGKLLFIPENPTKMIFHSFIEWTFTEIYWAGYGGGE